MSSCFRRDLREGSLVDAGDRALLGLLVDDALEAHAFMWATKDIDGAPAMNVEAVAVDYPCQHVHATADGRADDDDNPCDCTFCMGDDETRGGVGSAFVASFLHIALHDNGDDGGIVRGIVRDHSVHLYPDVSSVGFWKRLGFAKDTSTDRCAPRFR